MLTSIENLEKKKNEKKETFLFFADCLKTCFITSATVERVKTNGCFSDGMLFLVVENMSLIPALRKFLMGNVLLVRNMDETEKRNVRMHYIKPKGNAYCEIYLCSSLSSHIYIKLSKNSRYYI